MIDLTKVVTREERPEHPDRVFFAVKPSEMYPAMLAHIKETLATGKPPDKYLDTKGTPNPLVMYYDEAKRQSPEAWELAIVPYSQCGSLSADDKRTRNAALECARKWLTELLHRSIGGTPMGLHILAEDKKFKLC